jgi:hypothetical protein
VTAESVLTMALFVPRNCHTSGKGKPATPVLTLGGLTSGNRKPLNL